jgi:hypothetical protein
VIGGDFIDRPAITAAMREALSRLAARGALRSLRCAMALPASATLTTRVPLARLTQSSQVAISAVAGRDPRGLLEPAVLAEAERVAGIERGALAVDWSIEARANGDAEVLIAATGRQYVESRVETAAAANIVLSAIDGEPGSALRALLYSARMEIDPRERFVACWVESAGLHAWVVGADGVENEVRYPTPEYSSATDALTDLVGDDPDVHWIYIGGDIELLNRAGVSTPMLAALFGCPVMPFECAPFLQWRATGRRTFRAFVAIRGRNGPCAARGDVMSAVGLHTFNLLPYRTGARRRARNQALALLAGAGSGRMCCGRRGSGLGCVGAEAYRRETRLARRGAAAIERADRGACSPGRAPSAGVAHTECRRATSRAARPVSRLAWGTSQGNIGLQRVTQRVSEVELAASAPDSHAAAAWLKGLEKVAGVGTVEIVEMRRRVVAVQPPAVAVAKPGAANLQAKTSPYDFIAVVRWTHSTGGDATQKLLKAARQEVLSKQKAVSRSPR